VTQFRRRSWQSPRSTRNEGMRLSSMIALLVIVVCLMLVADQPGFWSHLFPNLDQPSPTSSAAGSASPAPKPPTETKNTQAAHQQSRLLLAGLIVAAIAYSLWRITRLMRAVAGRTKQGRVRFERTNVAPRSRIADESAATPAPDNSSEAEPETPVPIEEPHPRGDGPPIAS
jgi:hypothetical protein